jgi:hypothetical protein
MRLRVVNLVIIQVLYRICTVRGTINSGVLFNVVPREVISATSGWSHRNTTEFVETQMLANLRRSMSHSSHSPLNTLLNSHSTPDHEFSFNTQWSPTNQQSMEGPELVNPPGEVEVLTAVCNTVGCVRYRAVDVHDAMCSIFRDVYLRCGGGYTESFYQKSVLRAAYLKGLPVMMERDLFADFGDGSLLAGRVDLEVAGVCLYELKVGPPKIMVDSKQVKKYLKTYDKNEEDIQIASLVYFGTGHVFIHNVRERIDSGRSIST